MMLSTYQRKKLDALIEEYASCRENVYYLQDQGTGRDNIPGAIVEMNEAKLSLMLFLDKFTKDDD